MTDVVFVDRRELSPNVWEYSFRPLQPVPYTPGQYSRFTFPFHIDDPHGKQHRTFSFTSHPSEDTLRTLIRFDEPLSIFKQQLVQLVAGDHMHIDEPHGDAVLPRLGSTPLVFVAQGIAIASYISMLQEVRLQQLQHHIALFWAKRASDAGLESLLGSAPPLMHHTDIIYPDRLATAPILAAATDDNTLLYLSGSQRFVETLGASLEHAGIPRERIIYDYYEGYDEL